MLTAASIAWSFRLFRIATSGIHGRLGIINRPWQIVNRIVRTVPSDYKTSEGA
jgi:hypothetical protein